MHFAKWKEPDSSGYILCDSIYVTLGKKQNDREKTDQWLQGEYLENKVLLTAKGSHMGVFSVMELFWVIIMMVNTWLYATFLCRDL